jgi:cytosine/adenosine deaminase-related metal-dependent hydrolase
MKATSKATSVSAGCVFTHPGKKEALGPSAIHVADGRIVAIESLPHLQGEAVRRVILPAPANAHDHGRGLPTVAFSAYDESLETWVSDLSREPHTDAYLRAVVAFARMAEGGICATNHCHNTQQSARLFEEAQAVSRAARDVGMRVAFAVPFAGRNSLVYGNVEPLLSLLPEQDHADVLHARVPSRTLAQNMALVEKISALEHEFFEVQFCPVGPQWVDDDALKTIAEASAATGRRVHMHLFETRRQREWADAHYPGGLMAFLDSIGMLSPRLTVAHCVWLSSDDCDLLAARGVVVSVNASSNMRLRSGAVPLDRFLKSGLRFGIGLDGMSLDDDDDMLREMRLIWHLGQTAAGGAGFEVADLFDAACVDGRSSITGQHSSGIEVGAPADLLVLDSDRIMRDAVGSGNVDLLRLLLARMTKQDIHQLIVAGRIVVEDRRCVSVDLPALSAQLMEQSRQACLVSTPDGAKINRLKAAINTYYRCGCHTARS